MKQADQRFLFRGSAVSLAGHIRRPVDIRIPSQASSVIPVTGGESHAEAKGSRFGDVVEFASASSDISADFDDLARAARFTNGNFAENRLPTSTTVKSSLTGLIIKSVDEKTNHVLTCASLSIALTSRNAQKGGQPSIKPLEATIDKLALDGFAFDIKFHTRLFSSNDTKEKLTRAFEEDDAFFAKNGNLFFTPPGAARRILKGRRRVPQAGGLILASMVQSIGWVDKPHPNVTIDGNRIFLPDFGTIFVGELLISDFARRFTMLRLQIGSPQGGELSCGEIETDGHTYPP